MDERQMAPTNQRVTGPPDKRASGWAPSSLWFTASLADQDRRPPLNRERVVAEALTVIAEHGVEALTMRTLAARLGVVPATLYRHVRNKEQLQDLVLNGVLAEVDCDTDPCLPWTERIKVLAHRLRAVLENHPGAAGLLKLRDPLGPHSLALAEAFLAPLQAAGLPHHEIGLAFFLVTDYTIGFAVSSPHTSVNEQRVHDTAIRNQLHEFFRSLPPDRFPALVTLGAHVWLDNRDQRFTAGLDVLVDGLKRRGPTDPRKTPNQDHQRPNPQHPAAGKTDDQTTRQHS